MSTALVSAVNDLDLPAEPGISPRAARTVLRVYAKIAQRDGSFRYGLRGSKIASLADYSLATIRRVQRYLVAHGFLEKTHLGGGRASTRWKIVLEKLGIRHTSRPAVTPQPSPRDTAQEREPKRVSRMFSSWRHDHNHDHDHDPGRRPPPRPEATPPMQTPDANPSHAPEPVFDTCKHGGRAGLMSSGLPWCPSCRRQESQVTST